MRMKKSKVKKRVIITVSEVDIETGEVLRTTEQNSKATFDRTVEYTSSLDDDEGDEFKGGEGGAKGSFKSEDPFGIAYDKFFRKLLDNFNELVKNRLSLLILFYLILNMTYNRNALICSQKKMAGDLGVFPSHVSDALKVLYKLDFCCKAKFSKGGYEFMVNPDYVRKCDKTKLPQLHQIYGKLTYFESETKEKGEDLEKSSPLNASCNNIREAIKRSIKFGTDGKQIRLFDYLSNLFKSDKTVTKTVNEIAESCECNRKLVLKFLKLLETEGVIKRGRGTIELLLSFKKFSSLIAGTL